MNNKRRMQLLVVGVFFVLGLVIGSQFLGKKEPVAQEPAAQETETVGGNESVHVKMKATRVSFLGLSESPVYTGNLEVELIGRTVIVKGKSNLEGSPTIDEVVSLGAEGTLQISNDK